MNHKVKMELLWVIAVVIILGGSGIFNFMWIEGNQNGIAQNTSNGQPATTPGNIQVVHVLGRQWSWTFTNSTGKPTVNAFTVSANQSVELIVTSGDVIHDLLIPQMGVQIYAVPGQNNTIQFTPTHTGTYFFECVEYCGEFHYEMRGNMTVVQ